MIGRVVKFLEVAPVAVFALAAAFVASSMALALRPAEPAAWQAFMTLLPVMREPVYLITGLAGASHGGALLLFAAVALAGCLLLMSAARLTHLRFFYSHGAFLALLYAMGQARVFQAGSEAVAYGEASLLDWSLDLSRFPAYGVVLFGLTAALCLAWHAAMLHDMARARAVARDTRARVAEALRQVKG
ncbi:hypothetical protein [Chelativorans salis]|uniref:Uncharacterized protein n=1 Tax=Chelativorans salis TaxID=2978478 RepID=A0ABT2LJ79_9HYPH|nr:hypothetical protein [Chelativorans sp. EGI FJ00035]MCT7374645.1 hypothetical protein [Chelativorans sp. EGI FJ00035]